jgi:hypothetical protein
MTVRTHNFALSDLIFDAIKASVRDKLTNGSDLLTRAVIEVHDIRRVSMSAVCTRNTLCFLDELSYPFSPLELAGFYQRTVCPITLSILFLVPSVMLTLSAKLNLRV